MLAGPWGMRIAHFAAGALLASMFAPSASAAAPALPVEIREFVVPTPNALPHDPAVAPDGALWITEQKGNKLGRLDPRSGAWREYPLKTTDSGPHGLAV